MLWCPGSSWGFGALLKDTSVVVLRVERALYIHSPHLQFLPAQDSNRPLDYESDSLTIRPRLPPDYRPARGPHQTSKWYATGWFKLFSNIHPSLNTLSLLLLTCIFSSPPVFLLWPCWANEHFAVHLSLQFLYCISFEYFPYIFHNNFWLFSVR